MVSEAVIPARTDSSVSGIGAITSLRSGEVEAIEIHDLVPRRHEVTHKRLL